jgi:prephenate dehydratase/chorismate mutase
MDLENIRNKIDLIDAEILSGLRNRFELVLLAGRVKGFVRDPEREREILQNMKARADGFVDPGFVGSLFETIIAESRRLQEQRLRLAGFQGEHGAFSEQALRSYDPDIIPIPCPDFRGVFDGVKKGIFDLGIVPVENSLAGAVADVSHILMRTDLRIVGETTLPVHHCLMTLPETDHREVKIVYSHPQALEQCRSFIQRNMLEPRPFYDTAGAARWLVRERPRAAAVIAGRLTAQLYPLEILKENIEDFPPNFTRFVVIKGGPNGIKGDKYSVAFSLPHRTASLQKVLGLFAAAGLNMTRIASVPLPEQPGEYGFLLDFQGSDDDAGVRDLLEKVEKETTQYRCLGCYKGAEI